jgi:hypothetical protein
MRLLLTALLVSFFSFICYGQKKIAIYRTFGGGVVYEMDSLALSPKQITMMLKQNPEAMAEFKVAKSNAAISSVLGFTGGVLIGIPLGTAIAGGKPEWIYAGGGALLILASIPFNAAFRRHALNAIDLYNAQLPTSKLRVKPSLYIHGTGASLVLRF